MGCTLVPPVKYEWTVSTVHVRQWCSLMSNYFNHLLLSSPSVLIHLTRLVGILVYKHIDGLYFVKHIPCNLGLIRYCHFQLPLFRVFMGPSADQWPPWSLLQLPIPGTSLESILRHSSKNWKLHQVHIFFVKIQLKPTDSENSGTITTLTTGKNTAQKHS